LENLEEMDRFMDAFDLPKWNQEDINHLSRSSNKQWDWRSNKESPSKEEPCTRGIYCQILLDLQRTPVLLKLFHKMEREGMIQNSFYVASITLIPKPDRDTIRKENYSPLSLLQKFPITSSLQLHNEKIFCCILTSCSFFCQYVKVCVHF
jgi:hypothetical protein